MRHVEERQTHGRRTCLSPCSAGAISGSEPQPGRRGSLCVNRPWLRSAESPCRPSSQTRTEKTYTLTDRRELVALGVHVSPGSDPPSNFEQSTSIERHHPSPGRCVPPAPGETSPLKPDDVTHPVALIRIMGLVCGCSQYRRSEKGRAERLVGG